MQHTTNIVVICALACALMACGTARRSGGGGGGGGGGEDDLPGPGLGIEGEGEAPAFEGEGEGEAPAFEGGGEGEAPAFEGEGEGEGEAADPGGGDDGCWQAATILDLTEAPGAGPEYARPSSAAHCEGGDLIVTANGIIPYEFQAMTPNPLSEQDYTWRIPLSPEPLAEPEDIPLLGVVGIAVNGLPFYGPNEGPFPDPFGDPVFNGLLDFCGGHTAQRGDYHYHQLLVQCLTQNMAATPPGEASPVIGWALDGYPIYGPLGCLDERCEQVAKFASGWAVTGDPETDAWDNHAYQPSEEPTTLDRCNGRTGPDGAYAYHATDTFPYILGCYHGQATGAGGDAGAGPGGNDGGGPGGEDGGPPPESIAACDDKDEGADCEFDFPGGSQQGTCVQRPDGGGLACRPAGGPPRP